MTTPETAPLSQYLQPVSAHRKLLVGVMLATVVLGVAAASAIPKSYSSTTSVLVYPVDPDPSSVLSSDENRVDMATEIRLATSTAVTISASEMLASQGVELSPDTLAAGANASSPKESSILDISFAAPTVGEAQAGAGAIADAYVGYRAELANTTKLAAETAITDRIGVLTQRLNGLNPVDTASVEAELQAQQAALADLSTLVVDATTVVDPAPLPTAPQGLGALQLVVGSLAGGLVLGVIAAYAAAAMGTTGSTVGGHGDPSAANDDRSPSRFSSTANQSPRSLDSTTEQTQPTEPVAAQPTEPAHPVVGDLGDITQPVATEPAQPVVAVPKPPIEPVRPAATATTSNATAEVEEPAPIGRTVVVDEATEVTSTQDDDERSATIRQAVADYERAATQEPSAGPQLPDAAAPSATPAEAPSHNGSSTEQPSPIVEAGPAAPAPVAASPDMDRLIERFQELGRVGSVVGLTLGEEGAGTSIAVAFDLADALQSLGARVLLIETAVDDPMLAPLLSAAPAPGLNEVLCGQATLGSAVHSVGGLAGLDALTIGDIGPSIAADITGPPFERLLEEAKVSYHSIIIIAGSADDPTVPAMAGLSDGLILGTSRVAGSELGDGRCRQLAALPAPLLAFVSETVVVERTDEAAIAVGSSM